MFEETTVIWASLSIQQPGYCTLLLGRFSKKKMRRLEVIQWILLAILGVSNLWSLLIQLETHKKVDLFLYWQEQDTLDKRDAREYRKRKEEEEAHTEVPNRESDAAREHGVPGVRSSAEVGEFGAD